MRGFLIKAVCLCMLFISGFAYAKPAPTAPEKVIFGVYPVSIYDLDPMNNSFNISFYAWWRSKDKNFDPTKQIEIVNAHEYTHKFGDHGITDKGDYYTFVHYYAKIHQQWNPKYFPFSRQFLEVKMEAFNDNNSISFIPDMQDSHLHSEFTIPGWDVVSFKIKQSTTKYDTDFGNNGAPNSLYDRLSFIVEIKHHGIRSFFSYYIGFFMAGLLAHIIYLMTKFPYPARATIFIGAVFSFVGNKYILDQRLPITSQYTLADAIQASTFVVIFLSILVSIISESVFGTNEDSKRKISYIFGSLSMVAYTLYIAYYTYLAVIS